jgi:hypothetical protein
LFRLRAKNVPIPCIFCGGVHKCSSSGTGRGVRPESEDFHFWVTPRRQGSKIWRDCAEIDLFRLRAQSVPIPCIFCGGYTNARVPVHGGVPARSRKIFHFWVAYIIPPLYIMGGGLREKFRFRGVLGGVRAGVQVREFGDTAGCRNKPGTT